MAEARARAVGVDVGRAGGGGRAQNSEGRVAAMGGESVKRLQRDLKALYADPVEDMWVVPNDRDIHEWHFVLRGAQGTPYEDGMYHGKILFPKSYPMSPPGIVMLTPSGRFEPGHKICLSISDFHPETWSASYRVASILLALLSFMNEETPSTGALTGVAEETRRQMARDSLAFNVGASQSSATFKRLFPSMAEPGWTLPPRRAGGSAPGPAPAPVQGGALGRGGSREAAAPTAAGGGAGEGTGEVGGQGPRVRRAAAKPRDVARAGAGAGAGAGAAAKRAQPPGAGVDSSASGGRHEVAVAVLALVLAVYVLFYL